jgi:hypothetical protein
MKSRSQDDENGDLVENYDPNKVYSFKDDEEEENKRPYCWLEEWDSRSKGFLPLHFEQVHSVSSNETIQQKIQQI